MGLPGRDRQVFSSDNFEAILSGQLLIDPVPSEQQLRMVDKKIERLVKDPDGAAKLTPVVNTLDVIKLAGQAGRFDLAREYGVPPAAIADLDCTTQFATAAALEALRDAGIPLVRSPRSGTPARSGWGLPDTVGRDTGVLFATAFPGYAALVDELARSAQQALSRLRLATLRELRTAHACNGAAQAIDERIRQLESELAQGSLSSGDRSIEGLAAGAIQIAELLGARGPCCQVNAACASGSQALGIARDWLRGGHCRRVVVVSADDVTREGMLEWFGAGFLAAGTASTESDVTRAALPFDRRRHGLVLGMGASGLVLETDGALEERGMRGIAQVLGSEYSNSAFHSSRLDVANIGEVMERLIARVEAEHGLDRRVVADSGVYVSHETYSPAKGGSGAAELRTLRKVFGNHAARWIITNTKGMTGHPMGATIEDAVAVKILETGRVPPIPNLREPDPELDGLTPSIGGRHPVRWALRFAAGFGSQIVVTLLEKVDGPRVPDPAAYQRWLDAMAGIPNARTVVDHKVLRVRDDAGHGYSGSQAERSHPRSPRRCVGIRPG